MSEPLYTARAEIHKVEGVHRRALLEDGTEIEFGVHGAIKRHYRLETSTDLPLPVDYVVAATGAWMLGTLNGALEAREIRLGPDAIRATVSGTNEVVDKIVTLTRIDVHYTLRIPHGSRDTVERALSRHREKCPTARSLAGAVVVEFDAEIVED